MRNKLFKIVLASTTLAILTVQTANARCVENYSTCKPARLPDSITTFSCGSGGWAITVKQYKSGQDTIEFDGLSHTTTIAADLPNQWAPDPFYPPSSSEPELIRYPPITHNNARPNGGRVCGTGGSGIGYGQNYYQFRQNSSEDWQNTQIEVNLTASNTLGLSATEMLEKFRGSLSRHANGQSIPASDTCQSEIPCNWGGSGGTSSGGGAVVPTMNRISWTDLAMSEMSGDDIFHLLNDQKWGTDQVDLEGLTVPWVKVLSNLGYIDPQTARDVLKPPHESGGKFIFRHIESNNSYTLSPIIEDDDELELIIRPKVKSEHTRNGQSWPTSTKVDQSIEQAFFVPGKGFEPNSNYCPENSPKDPAYIPQYVADPNVIVELDQDLKYLTDDQIERIENTGWRITESMKEWSNQDFYNSVPENPNLRRPRYECLADRAQLATSMSSSTNTAQTRSSTNRRSSTGRFAATQLAQNQKNCKIKDIAYYDALIERIIIVNPKIGSVLNHPCNKRKFSGSVAGGHLQNVVADPALPLDGGGQLNEPLTKKAPDRAQEIFKPKTSTSDRKQ